ncbi:MAG: BatA domain-containing protein [Phycisphaerae bacterium]|nr:BatA domain-containing protein [Phycisphaerae bacterium]
MFGLTYAIFLLGTVAIVGPILAHLLNRTRLRRVPFTMLQFLQLSEQQTRHRRLIHEILVLLLRCAILILIVLAFAGPVLKSVKARERSFDQHVLILDNSLSMARVHGSDNAWERMVMAARAYLDLHNQPENLFTLYTTNAGIESSMAGAEVVLNQVANLAASPNDSQPQTLMAGLLQIQRQMGRDDRLFVHVISDFTPHVCDTWLKSLTPITVDRVTFDFIAPHSESRNLAITSVSAVGTQDARLVLSATVANQGLTTAKGVVQAQIDSSYSEAVKIELGPGQDQTQFLTLDISAAQVETTLCIEVRLLPEDDLMTDNVYPIAVSLQNRSRKRVLLVGSAQTTFLLKTALETVARHTPAVALNIEYTDFTRLDADAILSADSLIFSHLDASLPTHGAALTQRVSQGGRLVIFNGPDSDINAASRLFNETLLPALPQETQHRPATLQALDQGVVPDWSSPQERDMLVVLSQYALEKTPLWTYSTCRPSPQAQGVWRIADQAYLVYWQPKGKGRVFWVNTSMDDSHSALTKSAAMPVLTQWMLGMQQTLQSLAFAANDPVQIPTALLDPILDPQHVGFVNGQGQRSFGRVAGANVVCPGPHALGWLRSISDPVTSVGIHPVHGENQMAVPDPAWVETQLKERFVVKTTGDTPTLLTAAMQHKTITLDKWFLWLAVILMFMDAFVTNRMQR